MLWNLSFIFFFKQKTAYEMRISDWSSDVCSSDLPRAGRQRRRSFARDLSVVDHELPPFRPAHPAFERDVRDARDRGQCLTAKAQRRHQIDGVVGPLSSEERRVGKGCVSTCRSGGSPDHSKKKLRIQNCLDSIDQNINKTPT